MSLKNDPYSFDTFRPNYELRAAVAWIGAGIIYAGYSLVGYLTVPSLAVFAACSLMAARRLIPGWKRYRQTLRLAGGPLPWMTIKELSESMQKSVHRNDIWLGKGFKWGQNEAQNVYQILGRNWKDLTREVLGLRYQWNYIKKHKEEIKANLLRSYENYRESQKRIAEDRGQPWIHGCGPEEDSLYLPIPMTEGHTLIIGTTGSGKTRCFDLLICQAILRNETVIIIDPKGDNDLREKVERACRALKREKDYYCFHPAYPEKSIRLNLLANWTRPTELASRIAALMPTSSGSDPFTSFAWLAINSIAQAYCNVIKKNPTLKSIRHFIEGEMPKVVCSVIEAYMISIKTEEYGDEEEAIASMQSWWKSQPAIVMESYTGKAAALIAYYRQADKADSNVDGIIQMYEHDATHFSKMITSLIPTLSMLTSGQIGEMLSPPDAEEVNDVPLEGYKDIGTLIKSNCVLYFGLDNLSDAMVGSAIGSLGISDITSVAGMRYDFEVGGVNNDPEEVDYENLKDGLRMKSRSEGYRTVGKSPMRPINVFIDEATEVTNLPLLQLLNKGRGAKVRLTLATQTVKDFAAVMGSEARASQFLGNMNNVIALCLKDNESAKFVAENFPKTKVSTVQHMQSQSVDASMITAKSASTTQRREEVEVDIFPRELLLMLPPLEYIAHLAGGNIVKGRFPLLLTDDKQLDRVSWNRLNGG